MENKDYRQIAIEITNEAVQFFGQRLGAVLLYGSSIVNNQTPNDLDIIIVLNDRESDTDIAFIEDKIRLYSIEMDLQIINTVNLDAETFAHDSHGQFFIKFLQHAECLYGVNPFLKINPAYTTQITSVLQKVQYYYFRAKKIQANKTENNYDSGFHRKKIFFMLADFWLAYTGEVIISTCTKEQLNLIIETLIKTSPSEETLCYLMQAGNKEMDWQNIFGLYHQFYYAIQGMLAVKSTIENTYVDSIYTTKYSVGSNKLVIICSGCPSTYDEMQIATFLSVQGYDVVIFHYSATGKSIGNTFRDPIVDLTMIIEHFAPSYTSVVVLGNSYGGYAALAVSGHSAVTKTIAVSPVVHFSDVANIETLPAFLIQEDPAWYRFAADEFLYYLKNAPMVQVQSPGTATVIHGKNDPQISYTSIEQYCNAKKIQLVSADAGHLSLNRLSRENIQVLAVLV